MSGVFNFLMANPALTWLTTIIHTKSLDRRQWIILNRKDARLLAKPLILANLQVSAQSLVGCRLSNLTVIS